MLKGLSQWFWTEDSRQDLDLMFQQFPGADLFTLAVTASRINNAAVYQHFHNVISYMQDRNVQVLISLHAGTKDWNMLSTTWEKLATDCSIYRNLYGYDLINEPWSFAMDDPTIPQLYEKLIDHVRNFHGEAHCCIQSYRAHWRGYEWLNTNPVNRDNVSVLTHVYAHKPQDPAAPWYGPTKYWQYYKFAPLYQSGDYDAAKTIMRDEYYERFGRFTNDYSFVASEVATRPDEASIQYFRDLDEMLEEWNVPWIYHPYRSTQQRAVALAHPDRTLKLHAGPVAELMGAAPVPPEPPLTPPPGCIIAFLLGGVGGGGLLPWIRLLRSSLNPWVVQNYYVVSDALMRLIL